MNVNQAFAVPIMCQILPISHLTKNVISYLFVRFSDISKIVGSATLHIDYTT